jgi:DNA polymerase-1
VDSEAVERLYDEYVQAEQGIRDELDEQLGAGVYTGEGSDDALIDALLGVGVPLYRKTPTGKLSTDKFALQEFEDDYPIIETLMEWRRLIKFLKTYLEPMRGREVVHTSFRQAEAWTGRMSSTRPNMQNLPKRAGAEVRAIIKARPGYKLVVCDYDSIEVRLLAWYLGNAQFRELISNGHDPHAWMAAQIYGGTAEDFRKDGPRNKERAVAKNSLFAITYGAGAPRIADMNKISRDKAKSLISKIKGSLPGYYKLQDRIRNKIEREGYVTTLFGRTQLVNRDKAYVGLNALIQGSAADIMKQGLVNVAYLTNRIDAHILLVVHDEIVVEVPEAHADTMLTGTVAAMECAYDLDPPLEVTGTIVDNYAQAN